MGYAVPSAGVVTHLRQRMAVAEFPPTYHSRDYDGGSWGNSKLKTKNSKLLLLEVEACLSALVREQPSLAMHSSCVAGEVAVGADDAVTGNDDGYGVACVG